MGCAKWFQLLLDNNNYFPIATDEKDKMLHFAILLFEQLWMWRNKIRLGAPPPKWDNIAKLVVNQIPQYWRAGQSRKSRQCGGAPLEFWSAPPLGKYKINSDASLFDNSATAAIVLRNNHGIVLGAWINYFFSSNSFCSEIEAAIQALEVAEDMKLSKVWTEGDALQVVLSL